MTTIIRQSSVDNGQPEPDHGIGSLSTQRPPRMGSELRLTTDSSSPVASVAGSVSAPGAKIVVDGLNLWFGSNHVLKNVCFSIPPNAVTAIMGPSGCGKSTLLRTINRMNDLILGTRITGDIRIDGESIFADATDVIDLRKRVGMVFQKPNPFPKSIYENIAFSQFLKKRPKEEIGGKVREMLALVQLDGFESRKPDQLSGGQCQRIALARALINQPRVLLLDEPLGALDLKIRKQMQIELKKIQDKLKITFLYVTHDQEEALVMSDRIVLMNSGEAVQVDTPQRIYNLPNSRFSATFIGESNVFEGTVADVQKDHFVVNVDGVRIVSNKNVDVKTGDTVFLAIRLEKVKRVPPGGGSRYENQVEGKIEDIVFFGSIVKYYVRVSPNMLIIAEENISDEADAASAGRRAAGDAAAVGFMRRDVNVFFR
jgi:spermidine/putrescine transport system ATP-binding protein